MNYLNANIETLLLILEVKCDWYSKVRKEYGKFPEIQEKLLKENILPGIKELVTRVIELQDDKR